MFSLIQFTLTINKFHFGSLRLLLEQTDKIHTRPPPPFTPSLPPSRVYFRYVGVGGGQKEEKTAFKLNCTSSAFFIPEVKILKFWLIVYWGFFSPFNKFHLYLEVIIDGEELQMYNIYKRLVTVVIMKYTCRIL